MNFKDVVSIAAAVITSLGGGAAIVFGLSNFLGKLWADRAIEKEKHRYAEALQEAKAALDRTVNRYQVELDMLTYTHKLRTTEEFAQLRRLWKHFAKLRMAFTFHAGLDFQFVPADADEAKKYREKLRDEFFHELGTTQECFHEEKLFIPPQIAECALSALQIAIQEATLYRCFANYPDLTIQNHHGRGLAERLDNFKHKIDELENLMREHIAGRERASLVGNSNIVE